MPVYPGVLVAETTGISGGGTFYISASAVLGIDEHDLFAGCYDQTSTGTLGNNQASSEANVAYAGTTSTVSLADVLNVGDRETIQLWCWSSNGSGGTVIYPSDPQNPGTGAGITAILIDSPFDRPRKVGSSRRLPSSRQRK